MKPKSNQIFADCFVCKNRFVGADIKTEMRPMTINNVLQFYICDNCYDALATHGQFKGVVINGVPEIQKNVLFRCVTNMSKYSDHITLQKKAVDGRKRAVVILVDG